LLGYSSFFLAKTCAKHLLHNGVEATVVDGIVCKCKFFVDARNAQWVLGA